MKNKIDDLRNHLFETLEALKDEEKPMGLDRARAIAEVSKVIVESAKVEVAFLKVTGAVASTNFLPIGDYELPASSKRQLKGDVTPIPKAGTASHDDVKAYQRANGRTA